MPSLASIDKYMKWLEAHHFTWRPVEVYGPKNYERLKEPEVVQRCAEARGVISQPYKQAGSGWWRVRFIHAVWAEAVLLADPREVAALGDPYHQPVHIIEAMTDSQLDDLARAQGKELRDRAWSREQFVSALADYLANLPDSVGAAPEAAPDAEPVDKPAFTADPPMSTRPVCPFCSVRVGEAHAASCTFSHA